MREEEYETAKQAAERLGITDSQVRRLCAQGRIEGAISVPEGAPQNRRQWLIPKGAMPRRTTSGMGKPPVWDNG
jgi:excisionase family DNA binding protein